MSNKNEIADAVDSTMRQLGVKGQGVWHGADLKNGRVLVEINTQPSDKEMMHISAELKNQTGLTIVAGVFKSGRHGFLFKTAEDNSYPSSTSPTTPNKPSIKRASPKRSKTKGKDDDYWDGYKKTR